MTKHTISKTTLARLPIYLTYLKSLADDAPQNISATTIASELDLGEVQVRKDLASVSSSGKPRVGYNVPELIKELEKFLGYDDVHDAILVGAGKLGKALLDYEGFNQYGMSIIAAFDGAVEDEQKTDFGKPIYPMSKLDAICKRLSIKIGIITVPANCAQVVCDDLIASGVLAIWNFAPVHLSVPKGILVHDENMAASLAMLSSHLEKNIVQKKAD